MTTLTSAQLDKLAENIFIMGERSKTRLPKPATRGSTAFITALDPIASNADLKNAGIGVIDFTATPADPDVWLNNENTTFRIGSASKIAMMLAAVQLRLDVRNILALVPPIISTAAEFDAAFADPALWRKGKAPRGELSEIAGSDNAPQISKIFDFTKSPIDFAGVESDKQHLPANRDVAFNNLAPSHELDWVTDPPLSFSDRLWLTGYQSDNVAATTCVSEIGLPYIKTVLRAYGLDKHPSDGMHLLGLMYANIPKKNPPSTPPPPRPLTNIEKLDVEDYWLSDLGPPKQYDDKRSWVAGSAAALTAYMIALVNNKLGNAAACTTILNNLADGKGHAIQSFLVGDSSHGIAKVAKVNSQLNKIGILKISDGAQTPLLCEFVLVETEEKTAPAAGHRNKMKYAVIVTGLLATEPLGGTAVKAAQLLGELVHKALIALPPP
jgi:hypothetical protein